MYHLLRTCSGLQNFPTLFSGVLSWANRIKLHHHLTRNAKCSCPYLAKSFATQSFDRDSSIQNEVLVYEYENPKFFRRIKYLSAAQAIIWCAMGKSTYDWMSDKPENEDGSILTSPTFLKRISICVCFTAFIITFLVWWYMSRSIRQILLIRNKKMVQLQTYSPFTNRRTLTLPLDDVSGVISRHKAKGYIPLKVRGTLFYFLISTDGHLKNVKLFDNTIAVKRKFEKNSSE